MRQNYFVVIVAPKVLAPALMSRKCEDEEAKSGKREREEVEKRPKRERSHGQATRRGARLAAGGSNCVINLKVRFSRERTGGEKGRGTKGEERGERKSARHQNVAGRSLPRSPHILSRHRIYLRNDSADTELQVNRHGPTRGGTR